MAHLWLPGTVPHTVPSSLTPDNVTDQGEWSTFLDQQKKQRQSPCPSKCFSTLSPASLHFSLLLPFPLSSVFLDLKNFFLDSLGGQVWLWSQGILPKDIQCLTTAATDLCSREPLQRTVLQYSEWLSKRENRQWMQDLHPLPFKLMLNKWGKQGGIPGRPGQTLSHLCCCIAVTDLNVEGSSFLVLGRGWLHTHISRSSTDRFTETNFKSAIINMLKDLREKPSQWAKEGEISVDKWKDWRRIHRSYKSEVCRNIHFIGWIWSKLPWDRGLCDGSKSWKVLWMNEAPSSIFSSLRSWTVSGGAGGSLTPRGMSSNTLLTATLNHSFWVNKKVTGASEHCLGASKQNQTNQHKKSQ